MYTCATSVSPQAFVKALALISLFLLSHLAYSGDAEKSTIVVMDCPESNIISSWEGLSSQCLMIPGIIVGLHWIAVPSKQLNNCKPGKDGKPKGMCVALPKGMHKTAMLITDTWEDPKQKHDIYPIDPHEQGGFLINNKSLELTLLEVEQLHDYLGTGRDLKIASLEFEDIENSKATLVTMNASDEGYSNVYPVSHKAWIPPFHKFDPGLLGVVTPKLKKAEIQIGYYGVFTSQNNNNKRPTHQTTKLKSNAPVTPPFFYPEVAENIKEDLMTQQKWLGHIAYNSYKDGPDSIYFARLKFNEAFIKRVINPWYWQPYSGDQKPRKYSETDEKTKPYETSTLLACKDIEGNLGSMSHTLSGKSICTFVSRQGEIVHLSEGFQILAGNPSDTLQWQRWQDAVPLASLAYCNISADSGDENVTIFADNVDCLSEGLSRFNSQRLAHWHDPHVAMLCRVTEEDEQFIGRRSEVNDQCVYIKSILEEDKLKETIEYSVEFEVVSFKKRLSMKSQCKAIDEQ